jgi:hypothetical protein
MANGRPISFRRHPQADVGNDDSAGKRLEVTSKAALDKTAQLVCDIHSLAVYRHAKRNAAAIDSQISPPFCPWMVEAAGMVHAWGSLARDVVCTSDSPPPRSR